MFNRTAHDIKLISGKGLTVVTNVIKGNYLESFKELAEKKKVSDLSSRLTPNFRTVLLKNDFFFKMLTELVKSFRLDGFSCVSVAESVYDGLAYQ